MPGIKDLNVGAPICLAATGDKCGEGILWDPISQSIYWTDINRFLVHRYKLADATLQTWFFSEPVTCVLATGRGNTLALVMGSGVALWEPDRDIRREHLFELPDWPRVRCNDAGVDPAGALWLGTMRNNVQAGGEPSEAGGLDGVLYRVDGTGEWSQWRQDIAISNTLLWSPDKSKFYFGDSLKNEICVYDYDCTDRAIYGGKSFFRGFERGLPDGSAMDDEGYIWNCRYGGSCIVRLSPHGEIDRVVELPVANPTNCTFGGPTLETLFVTSASPENGRWERFGGCLFAIETNVTGLASNVFNVFPK